LGIWRDLKRRRFWTSLATNGFAALGAIGAIAGLAALFAPDFFGDQPGLAWLAGAVSFAYGLVRAWPQPVEVSFDSPNTAIKIVRGDLFAQGTNLAVGVCDTFDTEAPHIATNSVQWKFQTAVFGNNLAQLEQELRSALSKVEVVEEVVKPGKTTRYPVGTVAAVSQLPLTHFLVAYSKMDQRNKAHSTVDELWRSMVNLWEAVRDSSNGSPLSVPVFGGGQSGLSVTLTPEDAIRLTALSFVMASRKERVCGELRIVALPAMYDRLNHLELQAFLSSLKRS
jgi:hypothetical protein